MAKVLIDSNAYLSNPNKELYDKLYPYIEKYFPSKSTAFQTDIRRYIDKNNAILFASGPTFRLFFTDEERNKIFSHVGLRKNQVDDIIKADKTIDKTWYELQPKNGGSFNVILILIIRYYMKKKQDKLMDNAILYLALSTYSGRHFKSFPYEPNENIMNYTISTMSNKFKVKQKGTIIEAIKDTALVCHDTYTDYLDRCTDVLINSYALAFHTRISGFLNKIAEEYYRNWQEGNYLNTEGDDYSEENYRIADNDSFIITRLSDNVTTKILTKGIDYKIVKLSANICDVSVSGLQKSLQEIVNGKDKEIKLMINLILQLFLEEGRNSSKDIASKKFIDYCLALYIKSNTSDPNLLKIKELLDVWMTECSPTYVKTNRAASKSNLRKACYLYMAFNIQQEAIRM